MIQELIGGVGEERRLSIPCGGLLSDAPSAFLSSASTTNITTSSSSSTQLLPSPASSSPMPVSEPPQQNLRCPRCDSSNTKFCYYNNYNLTQPRHFCKTCRRYWTKGGALRNIPIGGGCRKAKPVTNVSSQVAGKPSGGSKPSKPIPSLDAIARLGLGLDPELMSPSPILWASAPQQHTSHLLALLRSGGSAVQNNPNPLSSFNPIRFKEEAALAESGAGGGPGLSLDPLSQFSTTAAMDSLWRNEGQIPYLQQQNNAAPFCDTAVGIQELYRRLRSPVAAAFCNDQLSMSSNGWPALACSSFATTDAMATSIGDGGGGDSASALEPAMGGEFGYWNPALSWSDMSTTNRI